MPGLKIKITTAGRQALVNAEQTGTRAVTIAAVGLTSAAFVAQAGLTALPSEIKRLTTIGGLVTAKDTIHVSVRDESSAAYSCYGFGLYLADGTLFGAYGQSELLVEKSGAASVLLALDVVFADVDTAQIIFGDINFTDPAATINVPAWCAWRPMPKPSRGWTRSVRCRRPTYWRHWTSALANGGRPNTSRIYCRAPPQQRHAVRWAFARLP
ncbi:hypothetical protein [Xanthomonas oryzae]|uniref:hypothetical protein n=1 Tax=Xanthomonas oryzae TaxID=347 RepID=UPI0024094E8A|nr:hypothetical protein [Xanthomonas oryzae]WFC26104.1 hypothetical protein PEV90_08655 [Xanthomonas oryzae pv. oryzae]